MQLFAGRTARTDVIKQVFYSSVVASDILEEAIRLPLRVTLLASIEQNQQRVTPVLRGSSVRQGDTIRCFLPLLERHPVRPRSCGLSELRLATPLSRR